jgi:hypothetical protein
MSRIVVSLQLSSLSTWHPLAFVEMKYKILERNDFRTEHTDVISTLSKTIVYSERRGKDETRRMICMQH